MRSLDVLTRSSFQCLSRTAAASLLLAIVGHPMFGQAVAPANVADLPASQISTTQITTLKTAVRRVDVNVIVTDSQGHPVTGLKQEDFSVEEEKTPQPIRTFKVHTLDTGTISAAPVIPPLPPNTFINLATAPELGVPTVILYDALNSPLTEQGHAHQELLQFIKHHRPGTQIAVFVLGDRLRLLQGFTADTDLLSAALASKNSNAHAMKLQAPSSLVTSTPGGMDGDEAFETVMIHLEMMDLADQGLASFNRWESTIQALTELGRFLASVPGRKNLIWVSSTFYANIFNSDNVRDGVYDRKHLEQIRQARDLLEVSHTAIYPVDIRGDRVNPVFSATTNKDLGSNGFSMLGIAQTVFMMQENASHAAMDLIADNTGGHAFYGTNGLQEAVNSAMLSGSTYYSLTYEPTNSRYDGSLRHVKVTLKRSGYNLSYRKTYYADDLAAVAEKVADAPQSPLTPSLERGTPLAHGLFLEAHLDAAGPPVAATPAQMQVLMQYEAMQGKDKTRKAHGVAPPPVIMQQYFISYGLFARQLEMPADDTGGHQASLELGVMAYDEDGRKLNGFDTRIDDAIPAARYAKVASDGYHVGQSVAVPVTAASIRLAVRDIRGDRVGSLEVQLPLAKVAEVAVPQIKTLAK